MHIRHDEEEREKFSRVNLLKWKKISSQIFFFFVDSLALLRSYVFVHNSSLIRVVGYWYWVIKCCNKMWIPLYHIRVAPLAYTILMWNVREANITLKISFNVSFSLSLHITIRNIINNSSSFVRVYDQA